MGRSPARFTTESSEPWLKYSLNTYGMIAISIIMPISMSSAPATMPVRARLVIRVPIVFANPIRSPWGFGGVAMRSSTFTKHSR